MSTACMPPGDVRPDRACRLEHSTAHAQCVHARTRTCMCVTRRRVCRLAHAGGALRMMTRMNELARHVSAGYGDYSPTTALGQMLFPLIIVVVLVVLPQRISDLTQVMQVGAGGAGVSHAGRYGQKQEPKSGRT
jgi:hypothetical protein